MDSGANTRLADRAEKLRTQLRRLAEIYNNGDVSEPMRLVIVAEIAMRRYELNNIDESKRIA